MAKFCLILCLAVSHLLGFSRFSTSVWTRLASGGDQGEPDEGSAHPKLQTTTNPAEGAIYRREMVKEAAPPMGTEKRVELEKEVVVEKEVALSPDAS